MKKNRNAWEKLLRFGFFSTLLVASAIAALTPDWAITLKAQGYVGYVDLKLNLQPGTPVLHAGSSAEVLVTLDNAGPADATRARTIALLSGAPVRKSTSGCTQDPGGYPDCELSTPLPAGGSADYLLALIVPPMARGTLSIGMAATSDDAEAAPGQEFAFLQLPIEAHVDLRANATCAQSYALSNVPLSCQVTLGNAGPAALIAPYFEIYPTGGTLANVTCGAPRAELCAASFSGGWWSAAQIYPGETVTLSMQLTPDPNYYSDAVFLQAGIFTSSGGEFDDTADYFKSISVPVSLFRDSFEGNAVVPAP